MKSLIVVLLISVSLAYTQDLSRARMLAGTAKVTGGHLVWAHHTGTSTYKGDSCYVGRPDYSITYTITAYLDSTAGTTTAYFCSNDDSTQSVPLTPPIGGNYGMVNTWQENGLHHFRIKGAVPVTVIIR